MAGLFETFLLPIYMEEREDEINRRWQSMLHGDTEFGNVVAGPTRLTLQLANTVRAPQVAELGPIPSWNEAVIDTVGDDQSTGIVGRQLRYLVAAVEETVLPDIPEEQYVESVWRLHRAAYFGLEIAAQTVTQETATLAFTSEVTGLRNRRALLRDIEPNVADGTPFRVIAIDMDGLKIINDSFGHRAGRDALNNLGESLSTELGEQDTAYHISGDEFCVVTREIDADYPEDFMSRVISHRGQNFSYGLALWPNEGETFEEVEHLADIRMQTNKIERKARGEAPERPR